MTDHMLQIEPVAYIRTDFADKFGLPRQSGLVPELTGDDVLRSGLSAGPEIRELLRSLRAGRIDGTIRSKEDELLRLRQAGRKDL